MKPFEAPATDMNNTENLGYYHAYKYHSLQRLNYLRGGKKLNCIFGLRCVNSTEGVQNYNITIIKSVLSQ
jgi:hypothetical protein